MKKTIKGVGLAALVATAAACSQQEVLHDDLGVTLTYDGKNTEITVSQEAFDSIGDVQLGMTIPGYVCRTQTPGRTNIEDVAAQNNYTISVDGQQVSKEDMQHYTTLCDNTLLFAKDFDESVQAYKGIEKSIEDMNEQLSVLRGTYDSLCVLEPNFCQTDEQLIDFLRSYKE